MSSAPGGISNRIFFAIFSGIFRSFGAPCSSNCKKYTVSKWPMHYGSGEFSAGIALLFIGDAFVSSLILLLESSNYIIQKVMEHASLSLCFS